MPKHKLLSQEVSERANELAQRSAGAEQAVWSKQMSERTNKRRSEWPNLPSVDFIVILPIVDCLYHHLVYDIVS